jgi:hypothetical protein
MTRSGVERRRLRADRIDALFFTFAAVAAVWFALLLLEESARPGWELLLLVVFWAFVAYLLLPRLHRILTRLYVPGYFIGRTRTSDGLLGDPINLALLGSEAQVHAAMTGAGWIRADDLDAGSTRRMITATVTRASYPRARRRSGITCASGVARRAGCSRAGTRPTGWRPARSTGRSG